EDERIVTGDHQRGVVRELSNLREAPVEAGDVVDRGEGDAVLVVAVVVRGIRGNDGASSIRLYADDLHPGGVPTDVVHVHPRDHLLLAVDEADATLVVHPHVRRDVVDVDGALECGFRG